MLTYFVVILPKQASVSYLIVPESVTTVDAYCLFTDAMEVDYKILCRGLSHDDCVGRIMRYASPETPYTIELLPDPLNN